MYDPIELFKTLKEKVTRNKARKYYRLIRSGNWYGGIATSDCVGCNLKCVFCWSQFPRDNPEKAGKFYEPEEIFHALASCARKKGYHQLRISGNEPTLVKEHLLKVLELVDQTDLTFILETNGILIDKEYARDLSAFKNLQVRVSLKGTNPEEFSLLTGAVPEAYNLQIEAIVNLIQVGVECWPAVMLSFSSEENFEKLKQQLLQIYLDLQIEKEYVFLYPYVIKRLKKSGIKPERSYSPGGIPKKLI